MKARQKEAQLRNKGIPKPPGRCTVDSAKEMERGNICCARKLSLAMVRCFASLSCALSLFLFLFLSFVCFEAVGNAK